MAVYNKKNKQLLICSTCQNGKNSGELHKKQVKYSITNSGNSNLCKAGNRLLHCAPASPRSSGTTKDPSRVTKNSKEVLMEDPEYAEMVEGMNTNMEKLKETENDLKKLADDQQLSRHLQNLKEHTKWSRNIYTPKTKKVHEKSDEKKTNILVSEHDKYLQFGNKAALNRVWPPDRPYLDRWQPNFYNPWMVARDSLNQTTSFSASEDPMTLQERHYLDEARSLYLLQPQNTGNPPLRAMKHWLKMPYSYYAWQNESKWTRGWKGYQDKLATVPSICISE